MQLSYWEQKQYFSKVDFVIIGSGIVGLNAAIQLRKQFKTASILVLERSFLPYGASTRNAGFACFGSMTEILDDLTRMTEDAVYALVEKRYNGLLLLRKLLGDVNIGYEEKGGYEVFTNSDDESFEQCMDAMTDLNTKLKSIVKGNTYTLSDFEISKQGFNGVKHLVKNNFEGQIDTGKMMHALVKLAQNNNITILNGLDIIEVKTLPNGVLITTAAGFSFTTKKLMVCNNGFAANLFPQLEVQANRAQVLITNPIEGLKINGAFHYQKGYYYFRDVDGCVLLGGGRNLDFEAEATQQFGVTEKVQTALEKLL
ncbi:MAG TPA: FAD-dependent oxidoreductase, partial [Bacteroidia bacterium]|nr:FAD-dependent oxidoreductase [Bacteroidia bacterium]